MSPREKRLLQILANGENPTVFSLRQKIGAANPADIKFRLTKKGWHIETGYIEMTDRDKRPCKVGYYFMIEYEQKIALEFLEKIDEAGATAPSKNNNLKPKDLNKINATKLEEK